MKNIRIYLFVFTALFIVQLCYSQSKNYPTSKALKLDVIPQKNRLWCWAASIEMITTWHQDKLSQLALARKKSPNSANYQCNDLCNDIQSCNSILNELPNGRNCYNEPLKRNEVNKLFKNTNYNYYLSDKELTWDSVKKEINNNRPFIFRFIPDLINTAEHDVVVAGYLEYKKDSFLLIKDPLAQCKGNEYLLSFKMIKTLGINGNLRTIKIYPKKNILSRSKKTNKYENNTYFDRAITMLETVENQNYLSSPLINRNNDIGAYILSFAIDSARFSADTLNKKYLLFYLKSDTSNNVIVSKTPNDTQYQIRQLHFNPKYSLLCCQVDEKSICRNNIEIKITINNGNAITESTMSYEPNTNPYLLIDWATSMTVFIGKYKDASNSHFEIMIPSNDFKLNSTDFKSNTPQISTQLTPYFKDLTILKNNLPNKVKLKLKPTATQRPSQRPQEQN